MEENSLASQSTTEMQFLQQVNECQQHLYYMEKLFLELKKLPENEIHLMKSNNSLNDVLMKGCESECSSDKVLYKKCESSGLLNEEPANVSAELPNRHPSSPLTFVIQVPNALLNTIKNKISNDDDPDFLSQYPVKQLFRSKKKARIISSLQKIFRKKKSSTSLEEDQKFMQNLQFLQFLKEKSEQNIPNHLQSSNSYNLNVRPTEKSFTEKNSASDCSTNTEFNSTPSDLKNKQTFIFPITYNFDENSQTSVKSTFTIQHEITPQKDSNSCFHSVKIINETPTQDSKLDVSPKKEMQMKTTKEEKSEMLLENLVKALHSTIDRLDNLETMKVFMEKLIEQESKPQKIRNFHHINKDIKIKSSKESMAHLMQSKISEKDRKKQIAKIFNKNDKQMSKRQSSKLSICSSSCTISSDDEPGKYSKPNRFQQHAYSTARCRSPSTFNYLVCQSERDIDQI